MIRHHTAQSELPSGYTRLQYIESTGTQYCAIPWNIGRNITEVSIVTYVYPIQESISFGGFIGTDVGASLEVYYTLQGNNGRFRFYINGSDSVGPDNLPNRTWYNVVCTLKNGIKTLSANGNSVSNSHSATMNGSPSYLTICKYSSSECYQGKIKDTYIKIVATEGTLEVNFIPALRNSDSKPGLYDTVNGVFYTNQGTGEFLYE